MTPEGACPLWTRGTDDLERPLPREDLSESVGRELIAAPLHVGLFDREMAKSSFPQRDYVPTGDQTGIRDPRANGALWRLCAQASL